jgi:hypothetical protein
MPFWNAWPEEALIGMAVHGQGKKITGLGLIRLDWAWPRKLGGACKWFLESHFH